MVTPAWLSKRMTVDVQVVNRYPLPESDEHGNVVYADVDGVLTQGLLQPLAQIENQFGRAEVEQFVLHLPDEVAGLLSTFSAFVINGRSYEAVQPPATYASLANPNSVHHVEITVQRSSA